MVGGSLKKRDGEWGGLGWNPDELTRTQYLILSTQGGIRGESGQPVALGYHTGHWEVGLLMRAAAEELDRLERLPFAAYVTAPCDGRSQGTTAMMDSLAYRNDAAVVMGRLIRSLPTRAGVIGVATCDKGLPATMLALAAEHDLPSVIVPGGVTLPPSEGEDAGKVQSIGARFAHGEITADYAAEMGCRACASPGGGCQFLGTGATSQVIAEALGMTLPHAALAPSGQPIWLDMAARSAQALHQMAKRKIKLCDILTEDSVHNAMVVHAAAGGSTNLLLHLPAIAYAAGLERPTVEDWREVNLKTPRFVDVLPNGPTNHPTVRLFLAGGVPEIMWRLRELGLLRLNAKSVCGLTVDEMLDRWEKSDRRQVLRDLLFQRDGVRADDVIIPPATAKSRGLTSTVCFPTGNICPEGAVIKATAIDPTVVDDDKVYRKTGPARVFTRERDAIAAIKGQTPQEPIVAGDIIVLVGRGPIGSGMEETYQITSALKFLSWGRDVAVITDARFSGVSTGACIGHAGPEALAGGPIGRVVDGDLIRIEIDQEKLTGRVDLVRPIELNDRDIEQISAEEVDRILARRPLHPDVSSDADLPEDTRLWAALQRVGGGAWGGCVYDVDRIVKLLELGESAETEQPRQ